MMTVQRLAWGMVGCLAVTLAGCEVSVGKCDRDAGECFDWDDEGDAAADGGLDGEVEGDAGSDGGDGGDGDVDGGDGDQDAGADAGDVGEPLTLEEFCDELSARRLAWAITFDECCSNADKTSDFAEAIKNLFGADNAAAGCISSNQALIDDGKVTFDENYAGSCASQFLAALEAPPTTCPTEGFEYSALLARVGHGAPQLAQIPACRKAIKGTVAADGACMRDFECSGELRCRDAFGGGSGTTRTCQEPLKNGICTKDADCAFGYTCVGNDSSGGATCVSVDDLPQSGTCGSSTDCAVGRVCDLDGTNTCVAPVADVPICEM